MSVQSKPYYFVVCDLCGHTSEDEGDYSAWSTVDGAEESAAGSDWWLEDSNHLCRDCVPPDRDDYEEGPS